MLRSMTGFGRFIGQEEGFTQSWEVKSVNGRHLDVKWRLPSFVRSLEAEWEKVLREYASRGRVEISLNVQASRSEILGLAFNEPLAAAMLDRLRDFADTRGYSFDPDLTRLMGYSFLWEDGGAEPDPTLAAALESGLRAALADWNESRATEGKALARDLAKRFIRLEEWRGLLKERAPQVKAEKAETLRARIQSVLDSHSLEPDESRLIQEIAVLSDRLDVTEELTRLNAHLEQLSGLLGGEGDAGKRLDFVLQECFREINTCGNKGQDPQVSRIVVDFKAELEKCREQVQNLE
jgi:uncharacterized protein (TIGR00255 family)